MCFVCVKTALFTECVFDEPGSHRFEFEPTSVKPLDILIGFAPQGWNNSACCLGFGKSWGLMGRGTKFVNERTHYHWIPCYTDNCGRITIVIDFDKNTVEAFKDDTKLASDQFVFSGPVVPAVTLWREHDTATLLNIT